MNYKPELHQCKLFAPLEKVHKIKKSGSTRKVYTEKIHPFLKGYVQTADTLS